MNRLKDYVRFIHGFQVYRPSHVDSVMPTVNKSSPRERSARRKKLLWVKERQCELIGRSPPG
jgi:hypothetical protein